MTEFEKWLDGFMFKKLVGEGISKHLLKCAFEDGAKSSTAEVALLRSLLRRALPILRDAHRVGCDHGLSKLSNMTLIDEIDIEMVKE